MDLVSALCERIKAPREFRDLALLVTRFHTRVHKALDMKPAKVVRLLSDCDAFRRPERFAEFLLSCRVDATGRTGFEDRPYLQVKRLADALEITRRVDAAALRAAGTPGPQMAEALNTERVALLTRSESRFRKRPVHAPQACRE